LNGDKKETLPADNSLQRFVKACRMLNKLNAEDVKVPLTSYAFSILENVSQGSFTKWSIVYDINQKEILFKTADNRSSRKIRFNGFNFNCARLSKMYDMELPGAGDITDVFINPDKNIKRRSLEKAIKESRDYVQISETAKERVLIYEAGIKCK
jgi:choloylglycine hydrolase